MIRPHILAASAAGLILFAGAAVAQDATPRAQVFDNLLQCRSIAAAEARLACYDSATAAFDTAQASGQVVVVDQAQIRATRRQLFGFNLPSLAAFGAADDVERADSAIETTLVSARSSGAGWVFRLADGSVWRQIDSERSNFSIREGAEVRVRRAAVGSFLMSINGSRGIRVRREE